MDLLSGTHILPGARTRNSRPLEPGTPATCFLTKEAGDDKARIASSHMPTGTVVHRLPAEVWIAVCEALRRFDLIDFVNWHSMGKGMYPEQRRTTTNKNRPDLIVTARSTLQLSQTCRYLQEVTSPFLLQNIRLQSPYTPTESPYVSVLRQLESLLMNSDQRLQQVRGFAVHLPPQYISWNDTTDKVKFRNGIRELLTRLPNLRHLTLLQMELDAPLLQSIPALPLEHLGLWGATLDKPITDSSLAVTTEPRIKLRSLAFWEGERLGAASIPANWISQVIGPSLQDLAINGSRLDLSGLPVIPDLEFLEVRDNFHTPRMRQDEVLTLLWKTPNLKELALELRTSDPPGSFPALSGLQRIVCHASWLRFLLLPGRPITTAEISFDSWVRVRELFEILHERSVPLRDLTLKYVAEMPQPMWSPDDLEPVARYLPELEILRLRIQDPQIVDLRQLMVHVSQLERLRVVSFSFPGEHSAFDRVFMGDAWQEPQLRHFLGLTKSPFLERISIAGEGEWKLGKTRVWNLWQEGRVVRSVSM